MQAAGTPADELREPADPEESAVVERYLAAFEAADVPGLTRLLADDVVLEMPPVPLWLVGRSRYQEFIERVYDMRGQDWHLRLTAANGSAALAAYVRDPGSSEARAHSMQLFDVRGGLIQRNVSFVDPRIFDAFGLPASTPASAG
jgi:RNA polymerase sigma-70 factor, ECF subfamily